MIKQTLKKALVGVAAVATLAGATFATTAADAHPWGGGWGYRGPGPAAAIGAGLLGVAIGASLAHPYYAPPPVAYYDGPGYWGYYGGCRSYWRWSPRWGHYVRVTSCY
jgi:hypothetical protein